MIPSVLPRANVAALKDGESGVLLSCAQLRGWQAGSLTPQILALAKQRGVHVGGMRGGAPAGEVAVSAVTKKRIQQDLMKL